MAKRVLGDDPFAQEGEATEAAEEKKSARGASSGARTSKPSIRPKASKPPTRAVPSKRPPRTSQPPVVAKSEPVAEEDVAPPPAVEPSITVPGVSEEDRAAAEESAAPADLPPDLQRSPISDEPPAPPRASAGTAEVKDEIRDLEAELDRLLEQVSERTSARETLNHVAQRLRARFGGEPASEESAPQAAREDHSVFDVARELLSSDYYVRQWGRIAMRDRSEEVDEFGLDPKFASRMRPFFDFLYEKWLRVEVHDIERVPSAGRVILCSNHSGALPYDGAMLATALRREHPTRRELRWLAEDFVFHFPFLGVFMNRIGAVRACQENAERLLRKSTCVGVFPEGVKGISKPYRDRYRLQRFGRGGMVKLAIRTRTPIVPVAVLGAEEALPLVAPTNALAKMLGVPYVPVTPTFPLLGPLGLLPLPSKWKMFFLDPIPMDGYAPEAADDEVLIGRLNEKIRATIQEELDQAVRARRSVFRG